MTECECRAWADDQRIGLGGDTAPDDWYYPRFKVLVQRTPWLDLVECVHCGQKWYAAVDTVDDWYYFHRLTDTAADLARADKWPSVFDSIEALWPDEAWLKAFGFSSLKDWQAKNGPGT